MVVQIWGFARRAALESAQFAVVCKRSPPWHLQPKHLRPST